jgi:hypothetical protein
VLFLTSTKCVNFSRAADPFGPVLDGVQVTDSGACEAVLGQDARCSASERWMLPASPTTTWQTPDIAESRALIVVTTGQTSARPDSAHATIGPRFERLPPQALELLRRIDPPQQPWRRSRDAHLKEVRERGKSRPIRRWKIEKVGPPGALRQGSE